MTKDVSTKEEPKEIKSPNWLDKNKFKEILNIIDSNKFGHKTKTGDFEYIDIKNLVNNIKDNTISEIHIKKRLSTLNIIKNSEIEHKRLIPGRKELLNLFKKLKIILNDKTLESQESENYENENEDKDEDYENKNEYEYESENKDKDYENKNEYEYKNENENEDDSYKNKNENENEDDDDDNDKTIDQNKIKDLNDILDEIIEKSKSFEEQIKLLKKRKDLKGFYPYNDFGNKELKSKYFK